MTSTYHFLGRVYYRLKDYEQANENLCSSLDMYIKLYGRDHPKVDKVFDSLGKVYCKYLDDR